MSTVESETLRAASTLACLQGGQPGTARHGNRSGELRRTSLLVYHRDGAELRPLVEDHPLVVGRTGGADLSVREGSLSRRHALFELCGEQVWVEDLGSTNGTLVNGERIERCRIHTGDQVQLGSLRVAVNTLALMEEGLYGLISHDRLVAGLEEELYRARLKGGRLALVLVGAEEQRAGLMHRWCPDLKRMLRPFDRAALYSPGRVELLLPEAGRQEVQAFVDQVVSSARAAGATLYAGAALFPGGGASTEELLETARAAHGEAARRGIPLCWAPDQGSRHIAGAAGEGDGPLLSGAALERILQVVDRVAAKDVPVLILGETGTGKEVVARELHSRGPRRERKLCVVNCGALPAQLLESTLFGHEKGAFTGAHQRTRGVFEAAHLGTVLLDEIGELSAEAQAALLRVLETGRFCRIGSTEEIEVDVRIVAATHRDLEAMCAAGAFRQDLLYRLNVISLEVPPLRDRPEELPALARHLLGQAAAANRCPVTDIAGEAMALLASHAWPGNVRELRNVLERGVLLADGEALTVDDLPSRIRGAGAGPSAELAGALEEAGFRELVERYEAELVRAALDRCGGDRRSAAELLGLPLRTFTRKAGKCGTQDPHQG